MARRGIFRGSRPPALNTMALKRLIGSWDGWLAGATTLLVALSTVAMMSAGSVLHQGLALRHGVWVGLGMLAGASAARLGAGRWLDGAWALYGVSLLLLGWVLVGGASRLGATRWLSIGGFSLQPTELAKLSTVLMLARVMGEAARVPLPTRVAWGSLWVAAVPAGLTFLQPDLGSSTIFVAMWAGMAWAAGLSRGLTTLLCGGGLAVLPVGWAVLKDYQRARLLAFLNPGADPLGAGYTIIQSTIAIGSGQLWGRGWGQGPQTQLRFLPERHSDFIFSVIGEEWGWVGCLVVLTCLGIVVWRALDLALIASTRQARLLAAGVASWLGYQALVNVGMVTGVLPVVGVPLPLVSYGGSSMVSVWVALGLLHSLAHRP